MDWLHWIKSKFAKPEPRYELQCEFVTISNMSMRDLIIGRSMWWNDPNAVVRNMDTGKIEFEDRSARSSIKPSASDIASAYTPSRQRMDERTIGFKLTP
jgi:hypothetical protein